MNLFRCVRRRAATMSIAWLLARTALRVGASGPGRRLPETSSSRIASVLCEGLAGHGVRPIRDPRHAAAQRWECFSHLPAAVPPLAPAASVAAVPSPNEASTCISTKLHIPRYSSGWMGERPYLALYSRCSRPKVVKHRCCLVLPGGATCGIRSALVGALQWDTGHGVHPQRSRPRICATGVIVQ